MSSARNEKHDKSFSEDEIYEAISKIIKDEDFKKGVEAIMQKNRDSMIDNERYVLRNAQMVMSYIGKL